MTRTTVNYHQLFEENISSMKKIGHPLSKVGKELIEKLETDKLYVQKLLENDSWANIFPSIENPHLEYFQDLMPNTKKNIKKEIVYLLNCVSIADGCSHQCSFCALKTPHKIRFMPYITILKIAQLIAQSTNNYGDIVNKLKSDITLNKFTKQTIIEFLYCLVERNYYTNLFNNCRGSASPLEIFQVLGFGDSEIKKLKHLNFKQIKNKFKVLQIITDSLSLDNVKRNQASFLKYVDTSSKPRIINYYRCDPFDYRDFNVVSVKNKRPVDYGDIYKIFTNLGYSVDIATACWDKGDKVAQHAATTIAKIGVAPPNQFYLSYHAYSVQARTSFTKYLENILNAILTICKNRNNQIIIRCETRNNQALMLFRAINNNKNLGIRIMPEQINSYLKQNTPLILDKLQITPKYDKVLPRNKYGANKLLGPFLGYSIDFDGQIYHRKNVNVSYRLYSSIWQ